MVGERYTDLGKNGYLPGSKTRRTPAWPKENRARVSGPRQQLLYKANDGKISKTDISNFLEELPQYNREIIDGWLREARIEVIDEREAGIVVIEEREDDGR